jgi:hypothetical protein
VHGERAGNPLHVEHVADVVEAQVRGPVRVIELELGLVGLDARDTGRVPEHSRRVVGDRHERAAHTGRARTHGDLEELPIEGAHLLEDIGGVGHRGRQQRPEDSEHREKSSHIPSFVHPNG